MKQHYNHLRHILLCLCLLAGINAFAYDAYIGGIYYIISKYEASVTFRDKNHNTYTGAIIIPVSVTYRGKTYYVTRIGDYAFNNCSGLTSVNIPNSVTSIGENAFESCSGLTSVNIPNSVTSIGKNAFESCSGLTSVNIPNSVTSIGNHAFHGCYFLIANFINMSSLTSSDNWGATLCNGTETADGLLIDGNQIVKCRPWATSVNIPNSVTSIGDDSFLGCSSLTSVNIPNSVASIGFSAFSGCSGLTSVTIPNSVTNIGKYAFRDCSSLTSVTIPNSVTSIGDRAFLNCSGLTSVLVEKGNTKFDSRNNCDAIIVTETNALIVGCMNTIIPNSVTSIGANAFYDCFSLTSVNIPNSVASIGFSAFSGCSGLTSVTINSNAIASKSYYSTSTLTDIFGNQVTEYVFGNDVQSIGQYACYNSSSLTSVTIGNNVRSIGSDAFTGCNNAKFYVNRGTDGLLELWKYGVEPYETGTSQTLLRPSISVPSKTQTSITYHIDNVYPDLEYVVGSGEPLGNNQYRITGLRPEYSRTIKLTVSSANNSYSTSKSAKTASISPKVISSGCTASSISAKGSYTEGDAKVVSKSLTINGTAMPSENGTLSGLDPESTYNCKYTIVVEYGSGSTYSYEGTKDITTAALAMTTQQPKVISAGNVIVAAETNLDDAETNAGFEWRRTDWTSDFASNTGTAYLYEGKMEGYIRNLYTEKLWKYRPYYESNSGNRYYGEWIGIDPTNTNYFEPTVRTYAQINVTGNRAEVKGYAMRGTDKVTSQGFMYWPSNASVSLRKKAASIPANAKVVEVKGNVMIAALEDLEYETSYCYVAFVTTEEYETFYGEVQTFSTDADPDGIKSLTPTLSEGEGEWYDLSGRKIVNGKSSNGKLPKGINIIRMSDGTTRKVLIK